ncbi:hypothetical protein EDB87DRAFT_1641372 [Lactarius vividus]|nr:hypothetical protein EDB87DRAFT_1641372 [Lactarius vividus]
MRTKYNIIKAIARLPILGPALTYDTDSKENRMTASCSVLIDLGTIPLSCRSLRRLLLSPCASLTLNCASMGRISPGSPYHRQKSSIDSFPRNPGMSRGGRSSLDLLYSESASWSSSSDIFGSDVVTSEIKAGLVGLMMGLYSGGGVGAMGDRRTSQDDT